MTDAGVEVAWVTGDEVCSNDGALRSQIAHPALTDHPDHPSHDVTPDPTRHPHRPMIQPHRSTRVPVRIIEGVSEDGGRFRAAANRYLVLDATGAA